MKHTLSNIILFALTASIVVLFAPDILSRSKQFVRDGTALVRPSTYSRTQIPQSSSGTASSVRPIIIKPDPSPPLTSSSTSSLIPPVVSLSQTQKTSASRRSPVAKKPVAEAERVTSPVVSIATTSISEASPAPVQRLAVGDLNQQEIFDIVNIERGKEGLFPLTFNKTLTLIADVKVADMITKQYFEHVSPDGTNVSKLAERYGYEYLRVGENLAMGDFTSSAEVMTGWMNSPGHRANILNKEYMEIGISARQGMHDGRLMWYVVQEFGRPASLCQKPDELLAKKITLYQGQLVSLDKTMASLREEIVLAEGNQELYNAKANDFNTIVELYNTIVSMTKEAIQEYNASADTYNNCIR